MDKKLVRSDVNRLLPQRYLYAQKPMSWASLACPDDAGVMLDRDMAARKEEAGKSVFKNGMFVPMLKPDMPTFMSDIYIWVSGNSRRLSI